MNRKKSLSFGLILFLMSFLFILTGLYLDYCEKQSYNDPIRDVVTVVDGSTDVIISTTDNDKDNPFGNNVTETVPPIVNTPNPNSNSGDTLNDGSTEPNGELNQKNEAQNDNLNQAQLQEKANTSFKKTIEETYGIKIKYGSDTSNYIAGNMTTIPMTDPMDIQNALTQLNRALSLYPHGFFREFNDVNLSLEIFLIQKYSTNNVTGITDLSGNRAIISIAMDYPFSESFHHEIYHYIEHFIERKHGKFSNWNTYNPPGFKYGVIDNTLSFNRTKNSMAPFVNNYAQTNEDEDRASLFEYMTADFKSNCFDSTEYPIWKKSSYMALMIDTYFETVSPTIIDYWERYVYQKG